MALGCAVLLGGTPLAAIADQVTDSYVVSSWSYSKLTNAGHGLDSSYVPTASDMAAATLQGFVVTPPGGYWGGPDFLGDDSVYVFAAEVRSDSDVTIPLVFDGDDGHSVFVDGAFVGGGGWAAQVEFDLHVRNGQPVVLQLAGYNATGPWVFRLVRRDGGLPLTSVPGVSVRACVRCISRP